MKYLWLDKTAEANALGLIRSQAIVHGSYQIGPGGYAANASGQIAAAATPARLLRLFSTSQGVWALTNSSGTVPSGSGVQLHLSPDGIDPYVQKYEDLTGGRMHGCLPLLVDCGSDRLVLFEYCTDADPVTNNVNQVWYSTDAGENWANLLTTAAGSVRHFHGGYYDAWSGRLYVFTGDSAVAGGIVFTDDVDDLFANPATWKTRWGLDDSTRSTLAPEWNVGNNDARYRTVSAIVQGDYIYWGQDSSNFPAGVQISRMERKSGRVEDVYVHPHSVAVPAGYAMGEMWVSGTGTNQSVLMMSTGHAPGSPYYGDNKAYVYALHPDGTLRAIRVIAGTNVVASDIHSIGGYTVISPYLDTFAGIAGKVVWGRRVNPQALLIPGPPHKTHALGNLLLETGDALLLETGDNILV